jgi:hypothetical protein
MKKTEFKQVGTAVGRLSSTKSNISTSSAAVANIPFSVLQHAISAQFELMKAHTLYQVDLSGGREGFNPEQRKALTGDKLWDAYLAAFPAGTNPIYRERTDHDCSCCRHFVKNLGAVVTIVEGEVVSIWDTIRTETPELGFYREVMDALSVLVKSGSIDNVYLHYERTVGTAKTFEQLMETSAHPAGVRQWNHFHVNLPDSAVATDKSSIGPILSETRATFDVCKRGLEELTLESVNTVLELIAQNSLYRGEEHQRVLVEFRRLKKAYLEMGYLSDSTDQTVLDGLRDVLHARRDRFVWANLLSFASRIRNTAIGTLLVDLSAGVELDAAVGSFESKVAPTNYKRPTALVTKAMIEKARKTIEELGYASALERRYATIDDIKITNVLFADRTTRLRKDQKNAFDDLAAKVPEKAKTFDKVEEVSVDKFLSEILPKAEGLEVMVENRHAGNFVSLVAPVDPGAKGMFKWSNNFSWSYAGEVADSIKERVKKAGGSVVGDLCCRLAWNYKDDLDFNMTEPVRGGRSTGYHISFQNRRQLSPNGGTLDLDANGCDGQRDDPAENIFYADKRHMSEGTYELVVHNYSRRSNDGVGFEVEVEFDGVVRNFVYSKVLRTNDHVVVAKITYSKTKGFAVTSELPSTQISKTTWGVASQIFAKVNVVMLSPNYWGTEQDLEGEHARELRGIGNRHLFFMLDGCANEDTARGFYNEFLSAELEPHRKVMEMVGAKMRTDESDRQLSGLGFSSTQRSSVLVRVKGSFNRVVKVVF